MWLLIFSLNQFIFSADLQTRGKGGLQNSEIDSLLMQVRNLLKNLSLPKMKVFRMTLMKSCLPW